MNKAQWQLRQKANNELGIWINNRMDECIAKGYRPSQATDRYRDKLNLWEKEQKDLDYAKERIATMETGTARLLRGGGDSAPQGTTVKQANFNLGAKGLGRDVNPFRFPEAELRNSYESVKRGGNYRIEGKSFMDSVSTKTDSFSSVVSQLPAQLSPGVVGEYFEARIMDSLPVIGIDAPSYEFIQHTFASDTGTNSAPFAGFTAEGAQKPQWNPATNKITVSAQKLALYFNQSNETLQDWPTWSSYLLNTAYKLVTTAENTAILYGTVSSGLGVQGWSTQSGILTHNAATDPAGSTNLDSLELAINQQRIQSGVFASPSIAIMNPTTWSVTRRLKATTGQYIASDPLHEAVTSAWGIPILTTTAANPGDCFLVDTSKMGTIVMREGLSMHQGYYGNLFIENLIATIVEERWSLATVIPAAVCYVTNLAVV